MYAVPDLASSENYYDLALGFGVSGICERAGKVIRDLTAIGMRHVGYAVQEDRLSAKLGRFETLRSEDLTPQALKI